MIWNLRTLEDRIRRSPVGIETPEVSRLAKKISNPCMKRSLRSDEYASSSFISKYSLTGFTKKYSCQMRGTIEDSLMSLLIISTSCIGVMWGGGYSTGDFWQSHLVFAPMRLYSVTYC